MLRKVFFGLIPLMIAILIYSVFGYVRSSWFGIISLGLLIVGWYSLISVISPLVLNKNLDSRIILILSIIMLIPTTNTIDTILYGDDVDVALSKLNKYSPNTIGKVTDKYYRDPIYLRTGKSYSSRKKIEDTWIYEYEFFVNGKKLVSSCKHSTDSLKVGDSVTIFYSNKNPKISRILLK